MTSTNLRVQWARIFFEAEIKQVIFTDETRVTLDGPVGWASGHTLRINATSDSDGGGEEEGR